MWMTLLAALIPQAIDIVKHTSGAVVNKWIGLTVDEQIRLQSAEMAKIEALAKLDNPYGQPSNWVVDLRASFRYLAAIVSIGAGVILGAQTFNSDIDPASKALMFTLASDLIGIPFGFIFGERMRLKQ
jgi:hypothetical protein